MTARWPGYLASTHRHCYFNWYSRHPSHTPISCSWQDRPYLPSFKPCDVISPPPPRHFLRGASYNYLPLLLNNIIIYDFLPWLHSDLVLCITSLRYRNLKEYIEGLKTVMPWRNSRVRTCIIYGLQWSTGQEDSWIAVMIWAENVR